MELDPCRPCGAGKTVSGVGCTLQGEDQSLGGTPMHTRHSSSIEDRLRMVRLRTREGQSRRQAARILGFSLAWVRKGWRRYRAGGEAALQAPRPPAPGPLA